MPTGYPGMIIAFVIGAIVSYFGYKDDKDIDTLGLVGGSIIDGFKWAFVAYIIIEIFYFFWRFGYG